MKHKITVLIGASGVGKTYLCRTVMGLDPLKTKLGWRGALSKVVEANGVRYMPEVTDNIRKYDDKVKEMNEVMNGDIPVLTEVNWAFRGWYTFMAMEYGADNLEIILLKEPLETFTRNIHCKKQHNQGDMTKDEKAQYYHDKTQKAMLKFFVKNKVKHTIKSVKEAEAYLYNKIYSRLSIDEIREIWEQRETAKIEMRETKRDLT